MHRSRILDCAGVCQFNGWYFSSASVVADNGGNSALNRAKLEAMHEIALFIDNPALNDRLRDPSRAPTTVQTRYEDRLEVHVLESGPIRSEGESRVGITVGARPLTNPADSR